MVKLSLSKSRYLSGLQCEKRLYFEISRNDDAAKARERATQGSPALEVGTTVGEVARQRYPKGVLIETKVHATAVADTRHALSTASVVFEAAFEAEGAHVRTDILERCGQSWRLHEVKSSTKLKPVHLDDLALQVHVLENSGVLLKDAGITLLNSKYERGRKLDLLQLFTTGGLLLEARARGKGVAKRLKRLASVATAAGAPQVEPGAHCSKPYDCPFQAVCIREPGPHSLLRLPDGGRLAKRLELLGISDATQLTATHKLSALQRRAAAALVSGKPQVMPVLKQRLAALHYPLHFIDFETVAFAIPRYPKTRPFQQLPCQWSLHIARTQDSFEHMGEFLHDQDTDSRQAFIESLLRALQGAGDILVYSGFEVSRLTELAETFPHYAPGIEAVVKRVRDLLAIVKEGFYHHKFDGSFSIKSVLPALTGIDYADLQVHNGAEAASEYARMIALPLSDPTRAQIRTNLLAYCQRDTLAMVEVLNELRKACGTKSSAR